METRGDIKKKEVEMTEKEMKKHFVNEPGLTFSNEFVYPNGSVYKGQMSAEERHGFGV
jgi:hypothetical protein